MAEAIVDGTTPMSRFFCHKCSVEIERLLPDYTCPNCANGFVEKLENVEDDRDMNMEISTEDLNDIDFNPSSSATQNISNSPRRLRWDEINSEERFIDARERGRVRAQDHLLHEFLLNLAGVGIHRSSQQITTATGRQAPLFFLGNPGDYVWSRDGLDTIVSELLNQFETSGPPPLSRNQIDELPLIAILQSHIDMKLQCSICWEDFILTEIVRQLPCKHLYHSPCIVQWLELHGTCPICRQSLSTEDAAETTQDVVAPNLEAFLRVANQLSSRSSTTTTISSSSPSSSSSNSSNSATNSNSSNDSNNCFHNVNRNRSSNSSSSSNSSTSNGISNSTSNSSGNNSSTYYTSSSGSSSSSSSSSGSSSSSSSSSNSSNN